MAMRRTKQYEPISLESPATRGDGITIQTEGYVEDIERVQPQQIFAFGALGLLNNVSYVVCLAAAKDISEGGTALVFLASVLPSLVLKLTAPYWFDKAGYHIRITSAAFLMAFAFLFVAFFSKSNDESNTSESLSSGFSRNTAGQLLGVAIISLQCGLGEASLLSLAGLCDSKGRCLTAFSSGTGLAGPAGYLWVVLMTEWLNLGLDFTVSLASILGLLYGLIYRAFLWDTASSSYVTAALAHAQESSLRDENDQGIALEEISLTPSEDQDQKSNTDDSEAIAPSKGQLNTRAGKQDYTDVSTTNSDSLSNVIHGSSTHPPVSTMSFTERFRLVLSLWPYSIPLFTVYAAEYACQAGAWTAIGFPVESVIARDHFYENSNWLYQIGVFLSRSSGTLFSVNLPVLWLLPGLQVVNLVFFSVTAAKHGILYSRPLFLTLSLYTGLLGGAVYVHGYKRIIADLPHYKEFALASTSVAESLGIMAADSVSLVIQSCLYEANSIEGALVQCPI